MADPLISIMCDTSHSESMYWHGKLRPINSFLVEFVKGPLNMFRRPTYINSK